jgi:hypothetical protein
VLDGHVSEKQWSLLKIETVTLFGGCRIGVTSESKSKKVGKYTKMAQMRMLVEADSYARRGRCH